MKKKKDCWHYIVHKVYEDSLVENIQYFMHAEKGEALRRATGYIKVSIENLCADYRMGKPLTSLNKIVFRLCYAESLDNGITYIELVLEEKKLADYLGNHAIH